MTFVGLTSMKAWLIIQPKVNWRPAASEDHDDGQTPEDVPTMVVVVEMSVHGVAKGWIISRSARGATGRAEDASRQDLAEAIGRAGRGIHEEFPFIIISDSAPI